LSRFEYDNTVEHLLGVTGDASKALEPDASSKFGNEVAALGFTIKGIDGYRAAAQAIAKQAAPDDAAAAVVAACAAPDQTCGATFIPSFGERAFRRPVTAGEQTDLQALFDAGFAESGLAGGVRAVVEAALQYPSFLYRIEASPAGVAEVVPSSWEMATRLSYLLWGSMPDAELFAAAKADQLKTKDQVLAQAKRMIDDPKAHRQVAFFHSRKYDYAKVESFERNPVAYPTWVNGMATHFRKETDAFVSNVALGTPAGGTFAELFTSDFTFLNDTLAAFYGLPLPGSVELVKVQTDGVQRGGLLTQGSVLMATTPGGRSNPVVRGHFATQDIFCFEVPPPPPGLVVTPPAITPGVGVRQRLNEHAKDPSCASCHKLMDPVGFAFENYDGVGLWRTTENDLPVDPSGTMSVTDAAGDFMGVMGLQEKAAISADAAGCYVNGWATYAYARKSGEAADTCSNKQLADAFAASGGNIKGLMLELTQTDAFLRRKVEAGPQ
ncbi:MAG: hypothetical protein RJA70_774, partial [Pseudomonadota bacterium]